MSVQDIKSITVWEKEGEKGAFCVKISCVENGRKWRFKKGVYKFFRGKDAGKVRVWQAAGSRVFIYREDREIYTYVCKLIHTVKKSGEETVWENPSLLDQSNASQQEFYDRIAVEYEKDLRDLQSMYERNGSC